MAIKKIVGKKRFDKAISMADERIKSFSKETIRLLEAGLKNAREGKLVQRKLEPLKKIFKKTKLK
jgi:hypothetical protein